MYVRAKSISAKLPQRPKLLQLTENAALASAKVETMANVTHLNLHGMGLKKIEKLGACTNLETLILSCNEIHRVEGLGTLQHLETLELSFNSIRRIGTLSGLGSLKQLNLSNNLLGARLSKQIVLVHPPLPPV